MFIYILYNKYLLPSVNWAMVKARTVLYSCETPRPRHTKRGVHCKFMCLVHVDSNQELCTYNEMWDVQVSGEQQAEECSDMLSTEWNSCALLPSFLLPVPCLCLTVLLYAMGFWLVSEPELIYSSFLFISDI